MDRDHTQSEKGKEQQGVVHLEGTVQQLKRSGQEVLKQHDRGRMNANARNLAGVGELPKDSRKRRFTQIEIGPQLIEPQPEELQSIEPQSASPEHESLFDTVRG